MDDPRIPLIIELAEKYRQALLKSDTAAINQIINAYTTLYKDLFGKVQTLAEHMADLESITPGKLSSMKIFNDLLNDTADELGKFSNFTEVTMNTATTQAIAMAGAHAKNYTAIVNSLYGNIEYKWMNLPTEAVKSLMGFLDKGSPLYERLAGLPNFNVERVKDVFLQMVATGDNPVTIAGKLAGEFQNVLGMGLTDAIRLTRTAQLWSYREASRANYLANNDVVKGWIWMAELDGACVSCVAMHGTFHELDETLDDHYNGRCAMLPVTVGSEIALEDGREFFDNLPEEEQARLLGREKLDAYRSGEFTWGDIKATNQHDDEVYGTMRSMASLDELKSASHEGGD